MRRLVNLARWESVGKFINVGSAVGFNGGTVATDDVGGCNVGRLQRFRRYIRITEKVQRRCRWRRFP